MIVLVKDDVVAFGPVAHERPVEEIFCQLESAFRAQYTKQHT